MAIKITFETEDPKKAAEFLLKLDAEFIIDSVVTIPEPGELAGTLPIVDGILTTTEPKKAAIAKKSRKTKSSKTKKTTEVQDVDLDDLRTALLTLGSTHNLGLCTDALSRVGVKKLSDVNESKYKELHTILLEAIETGEA